MDQILEDHAGIDYRLCDRPDQALTLLNKGEIDYLLLDIHMPAMDGLQMIQKVRELQGGTWLPTIFMASAEDVKSRGRALRAQGDAMLTKPIEPEILLNQLQVIERLVHAQAELKAAKDRVEQIAREDDLTGILNRRGIEQELHQALALSWRFNTPMSLLLIDVDRFRAFNETQGVEAGDQALKMIGQALSNCSKRQSDVLERFSGEEFVLGLPATDQAGALETMLDRLATYKEKTEALKAKIKKAMTYPIAVLVVAFIVTAILLIKVVPQFESMFTSFGGELPAFTQVVVAMSEWAREWWFIGLGVIVAAIFSIKQALKRSDKFAYLVDKYLLRAPIVGPIVTNSAIARYCRTLSTTFAAGVPLVEALGSAAGAAGNRLYYDAIKLIQDDVATGQQLQFSMRASGLFPNMVVQMVSIGEESGALDEMLHKAANHYEEAVDNSVDNLTSLMEPMIMSFLGVLIGGLVIAMYLPIFQMGSVV